MKGWEEALPRALKDAMWTQDRAFVSLRWHLAYRMYYMTVPSPSYLRAEVLKLPPQAVGHLSAPRGQVEDGGGGHVGGLHVVTEVEAALAAGAAGAAAPAPSASSRAPHPTAQAAAAAAGGVGAGGAAGRAGRLAVTLG